MHTTGINIETSTWVWQSAGGWQFSAGVLLMLSAAAFLLAGISPTINALKRRKRSTRTITLSVASILATIVTATSAAVLISSSPQVDKRSSTEAIVATGTISKVPASAPDQPAVPSELGVRLDQSPEVLLVLRDLNDIARLVGRDQVAVTLYCTRGASSYQLQCGTSPAAGESLVSRLFAPSQDSTLESTTSTPYRPEQQ